MKLVNTCALMALALSLTSCATPPPPQAFHNTDNKALVIESMDGKTCQIIQPTASRGENPEKVLLTARKLPQHQEAVVILENYNEPSIGDQFRDRSVPLFVGLRSLGYQRIVFLQGRGTPNPEGLITLAEYE